MCSTARRTLLHYNPVLREQLRALQQEVADYVMPFVMSFVMPMGMPMGLGGGRRAAPARPRQPLL